MFERESQVFQIGSVKIGGKSSQVPTVLIGSIFYNKHHIVKDELKGEFDREEAERLIKRQEEYSDKTGNPHMLDVVGATTEALSRFLDFVSGVTQAPILLDGVSTAVRIAGLDYIRDSGLKDRVVYNSLSPEYKPEELQKIGEVGMKSAILLAFNTREFTSQGRVKAIRDLLPVASKAGIEKPLIDTAVIDIPSLGMACRAIHELKKEFGLPVGSGAHNAIGTWRGLKKKMGAQATASSMAAACAITIAAGANFVLYGPIESADQMFPAVAMVDAAYAQLAMEEGTMPDPKHPIFRIA
jgi:tetrahydromethanopterin S-methyltransferase subunit H